MATTVNLQITLESLVEAIRPLKIEQKRQLLEILEQQIFEAEEDSYEDDSDTIAEIKAVHAEYEAGDYVTFDEYLKNRS